MEKVISQENVQLSSKRTEKDNSAKMDQTLQDHPVNANGADKVIASSSQNSKEEADEEMDYNGSLFSKEEAAKLLPNEVFYRCTEFTYMRTERRDPVADGHDGGREIFKARISELLKQKMPLLHFKSFDFHEVIGNGSYGIVWKAIWGGEREVAVKAFRNEELPKLYLERDALVKLRNKRIVQLLGVFHAKVTYFVMPLQKADLTKFKKISEINILRFTVQLLEAIRWMHSQNILHCDIKPNNCLVTNENNLVLADFGAAFYMDPVHYTRPFVHRKRIVGVPAYSDFEVNTNLFYSYSNDVFAAGCVLFELQTGQGFLWSKFNKNERDDRYEVQKTIKSGRKLDEGTKSLAPTDKFKNGRVPLSDTLPAAVPFDKFLAKILLIRTTDRLPASELLKDNELLTLMENHNVTFENLDTCGITDELKPRPEYTANRPEEVANYFKEDTLSLGMYYLDPTLVQELKASNEKADNSTTDASNHLEFRSVAASTLEIPKCPAIEETLNLDNQTATSVQMNINVSCSDAIKGQPTDKETQIIDSAQSKNSVMEQLWLYLKSLPLWKKLEMELKDNDPLAYMKTQAEVVLNLEKAMQIKKDTDMENLTQASKPIVEGVTITKPSRFTDHRWEVEEPMQVSSPHSTRSSSKDGPEKPACFTNLFQAASSFRKEPEKAQESSPDIIPLVHKRAKVQKAISLTDVRVPEIPIKKRSNELYVKGKLVTARKRAELGDAASFARKDKDECVALLLEADKEEKKRHAKKEPRRKGKKAKYECEFCPKKFETQAALDFHVENECDESDFI